MATRTTTKKAEPKTTTAKTAIEKEAPAKTAAETEKADAATVKKPQRKQLPEKQQLQRKLQKSLLRRRLL
jgi:hypothetical protein